MDLDEENGGGNSQPPINSVDWRDFAKHVTRNTIRYIRIFSQEWNN